MLWSRASGEWVSLCGTELFPPRMGCYKSYTHTHTHHKVDYDKRFQEFLFSVLFKLKGKESTIALYAFLRPELKIQSILRRVQGNLEILVSFYILLQGKSDSYNHIYHHRVHKNN